MEQLYKAVNNLLLINLIKHTTVYIVAHHWHNLTAVPKVPLNKQSCAVTLSRDIAFKTVVALTATTTLPTR